MFALWFAIAAAAPSTQASSVVIMPIEARAGVKPDLAEQVTAAFVPHAARATTARVTSFAEIRGAMSQEQLRQVAGCNATNCAADIAGALDADEIVLGTLGRVGDSFLLNLSRVQARTTLVVARATERFPAANETAILDRLPAVATALFGTPAPSAAAPEVKAAEPPKLGPGGYKEPVSPDPEAARLFAVAMRSFWDGTTQVKFHQKAVEKDPDLAASHLRLAVILLENDPGVARKHYAAAGNNRARLSERDLGLLEASRPHLKDPGDLVEWRERMVALGKRYPRDPEVLHWLGIAHQFNSKREDALASFQAAVAVDPSFAPSWWALAQLHLLNNKTDQALAATADCIAAAPYGTRCHAMRYDIFTWQGRCKDAEEDARRIMANNPESPQGPAMLARMLAGQNAPVPAVEELLRQRRARLVPGQDPPVEEQRDIWRLATWKGDFRAAEQALLRMQALSSGKEDRFTHESVALQLMDLYGETDQPKKACAVAQAILPRRQGWPRGPAWEWDNGMVFQGAMARYGCISREAFVAARTAYVKERLARLLAGGVKEQDARSLVWAEAYQRNGSTLQEAQEALDALKELGPGGQLDVSNPTAQLWTGGLHLRAGQAQAAVPWLRQAAQACLSFDLYEHIQAHLWLGQALEATGDVSGARAAYQRVVDLWGAAKPTSVSATTARKRLAALPKK